MAFKNCYSSPRPLEAIVVFDQKQVQTQTQNQVCAVEYSEL